ncbi:MAG: hypothetical protein JNM45_14230 [Rhizobiales bacterium]|nr:hypothetical protein [Hyphomicrobiales bacterium]
MSRFLSIVLLVLFLPVQQAVPSLAADPPGLIVEQVDAPHHGRSMEVAIWYPGTGGRKMLFADNTVFAGSDVLKNAAPAPGQHPVVLLSHGMGGTYLSLNWLASGLAERGAIVISVNHPNGSFKDRDLSRMFNHWTRVQDLQVALASVLADKRFSASIDPSRIYVAGFSFGGWTALSMGGATTHLGSNAAYCKAAGDRSHTCTDLSTYGLDPARANPQLWAASYKDGRIKAVAAIDPGLTWGMTGDDVKNLDGTRLLLIGLGTGTARLYATDTSAKGSGFEALVPGAKVRVLAPAFHFTAMPVCKPGAETFLADTHDDPVCSDPPGSNRAAVHDQILALVAAHFGLR